MPALIKMRVGCFAVFMVGAFWCFPFCRSHASHGKTCTIHWPSAHCCSVVNVLCGEGMPLLPGNGEELPRDFPAQGRTRERSSGEGTTQLARLPNQRNRLRATRS